MYLIDTNIFLEILLAQVKSDECETFLENLNMEQPGWISSFSLHAIEAILGKNKSNSKVLKQFLSFIKSSPFISVYLTSLDDEILVSKSLANSPLDFDDTLQYHIAKKNGFTLITLDKDFKRIRDIDVRFL